jgi:hypothetical protein
VNLSGTINNTGSRLALDATTGSWNLLGGMVIGGTVTETGGALLVGTNEGGELNGVTLNGDFDLTAASSGYLHLRNGLTLNGTISVGSVGNIGIVSLVSTETIGGSGSIHFDGLGGQLNSYGGAVTLGPSLTVYGKNGSLAGGGAYVNQGTIAADGGTFTIQSYGITWTNNGTVEAQNGGTFSAPTPTNFSGGTLTGGTWQVFANSTLRVTLPSSIVTNAAAIALDGVNSTFYRDTGTTNALAAFATNAGSFAVLDGAAFTTPGDFENDGTLTIGAGSTFSVSGNFTMGSAATLDLQLGGTSTGQYGSLAVTGTATLTGTLLDTLVNGYTPVSGDTVAVLTYGARSGNFTTGPPGFNRSFDDINGVMTLVAQ